MTRRTVTLEPVPDQERQRQSRLDEVAGNIKEKSGSSSSQRALGLLRDIEPESGAERPSRDQYGE